MKNKKAKIVMIIMCVIGAILILFGAVSVTLVDHGAAIIPYLLFLIGLVVLTFGWSLSEFNKAREQFDKAMAIMNEETKKEVK